MSRLTSRTLDLGTGYTTALKYHPVANGSQTALLSTYKNGSDAAYEYAYDDNGNITSITQGTTSVTYQYNGANELIREANGLAIRAFRRYTGPVKVNELKKQKFFSKRRGQERETVVIY